MVSSGRTIVKGLHFFPKAKLLPYSQQSFMAVCSAYHAGDCHRNDYSLYLIWKTVGYAPSAVYLLPVVIKEEK